jgi:hypothetical protein
MGEDRPTTEHGPDRRRVTVAEASEILGITAEAVRTRIKRKKLESVKDPPAPGGTVYVLLEADQTGPNTDPTSQGHDQTIDQTRQGERLVETLREQVAYLQGVIATRDRELEQRAEEIRRRDAALEREQQLTAMFADRLRELEAPREPRESSETVEEATDGAEPHSATEEAWDELGDERARRQMAENTLQEGMTEERRRREAAERERDELRQELVGIGRRTEAHEESDEQQGRGEPRSATGGAQAGAQRRPWWRRVFGR